MAIQRKPRLSKHSAADAFIQGAPDAQAAKAPGGQTYQKGKEGQQATDWLRRYHPALL